MEESNDTENGGKTLLNRLCFPYGPISTVMEFLKIEEVLGFRLLNDPFFEKMYLKVLSDREWALDELFLLNSKTSEEFRAMTWFHKHKEILSSVVGEDVSAAFDTIVVKYRDNVTTDYQERLFPLFVPKGKKGLTLRTLEHLFVLVYGNWPYRYDNEKNQGSSVYWYYHGKGAEYLEFNFLDDQIGINYSSDLKLKSIPRITSGKGVFREISFGVEVNVLGILHYQPHFGLGQSCVPVTRGLYIGTVGRGYSYLLCLNDENIMDTTLVIMEGKGGMKHVDNSLQKLCMDISSGKLFPHFYEILDHRQQHNKEGEAEDYGVTLEISSLFLRAVKDVKIVSSISRIIKKKMKKSEVKVDYSFLRHTISAPYGQRHQMESFGYPNYLIYPMR